MNSKNYIFALMVIFLASSCAGPVALFDYNQGQKYAPSKVDFENTSKNAEKYLWDFGDGNQSEEEKPSHNYSLSGKYQIVLTAIKGGKESVTKKEIVVDAPKECLIEIETSLGSMTFKLSELTPLHRDNFLKLAEQGFYEGLLFHRVIKGFMVQGGDPESKGAASGVRLGSGGPGYTVPAEFRPELAHVKGAIAAARTGGPSNPEKKSSGSQFYIVQGKKVDPMQLDANEMRKGFEYTEETKAEYTKVGGTPFLDQDYTVFGVIVEGMDVLDKIADANTSPDNRPKVDVVIKKVQQIR